MMSKLWLLKILRLTVLNPKTGEKKCFCQVAQLASPRRHAFWRNLPRRRFLGAASLSRMLVLWPAEGNVSESVTGFCCFKNKLIYIKQIQGLHIFVDKESKHYTNLQHPNPTWAQGIMIAQCCTPALQFWALFCIRLCRGDLCESILLCPLFDLNKSPSPSNASMMWFEYRPRVQARFTQYV